MKTGYKSIRKYKNLYGKCVRDEKQLIKAVERRRPDKEEIISVMAAMRGSLENIIEAMAKDAGITEKYIKEIMAKRGQELKGRISLFEKTAALEEKGALDKSMAQNVHKIRKSGNDAVHYYEKNPENRLVGATATDTVLYAKKMQQGLYKLADYYAVDFTDKVKSGYFTGKQVNAKNKKGIGKIKLTLAVGIIIGLIIAVLYNILLK